MDYGGWALTGVMFSCFQTISGKTMSYCFVLQGYFLAFLLSPPSTTLSAEEQVKSPRKSGGRRSRAMGLPSMSARRGHCRCWGGGDAAERPTLNVALDRQPQMLDSKLSQQTDPLRSHVGPGGAFLSTADLVPTPRGGKGLAVCDMVASREFEARSFGARGSNPRIIACANPNLPLKSLKPPLGYGDL